jgi:selenide, water dikinase
VQTHDIVLLGIGHTNAHVLRMWRTHPPPHARLTCVSDQPTATYSGMLPGVLAGQYVAEQVQIDLARNCAAAGARLVIAEACGLDVTRQTLRFRDGPPLRFDALSIGIGSVPTYEGVRIEDNAALLPIKPMQTLLARLGSRLRQATYVRGVVRVVVVGGGAGGVEVALCLPPYVRQLCGDDARIERTIVSAEALLSGSGAGLARRVSRRLREHRVQVIEGRRVATINARGVLLEDGNEVPADVILWATGAAAPSLLGTLGLPLDARGFLLTDDTLRSVSGAPVFAVGDCGTIAGREIPKAGVYAVRQGPVLWDNIRRLIESRPLRAYRPQRNFLKLLNAGEGSAIGEWKGLSFEGRWCWHVKDRIDRRFMHLHQAV